MTTAPSSSYYRARTGVRVHITSNTQDAKVPHRSGSLMDAPSDAHSSVLPAAACSFSHSMAKVRWSATPRGSTSSCTLKCGEWLGAVQPSASCEWPMKVKNPGMVSA